MIIGKVLKYCIYILCICNLIGCGKNINFPKIEEGIFSGNKESFTQKKKIKILTGDSIKSISKKYGVSIRELIRFNKLKSPYILKPGKNIFIPDPIYYKIRKGDSLFKISKCSKVYVEDLLQRNKKIEKKKLQIGSRIKLPYFAKPELCKKTKKINRKNIKKNKKLEKIFKWPISGELIATFGSKGSGRRNDGINIKAPFGSPVRAAKAGKVIYRGNELPAWGNLILVKHENGWTTAYAHLDKFYVKLGTKVRTGDILGSVGKTGNVNDYQLHFQVRKYSKPLDPINYLFE